MKIWKHVFQPNSVRDDYYAIQVPAKTGAKPISVAKQGADCCVWFEVDPTAPPASFTIYIVGTGFGRVPEGKKFLGTILDGVYVWHVYT